MSVIAVNLHLLEDFKPMNNELAIVGKATPNEATGDIELYLPEYRNMLQNSGKFVYAWSFNPDDRAINTIRQYLNNNKNVFIYLPYDGSHSNLRMHVIDFHHDRNVVVSSCPPKWQSYCFINYVTKLQAVKKRSFTFGFSLMP
jgi:hypothetical protein